MAKRLIIPDVHNKTFKVKKLLDKIGHEFDEIIQLGDWFDDFYDTPEDVSATVVDINFLDNNYPMRYLWGNHDLPYRFPSKYTMCPGFTLEKQKAIVNTLDKDIWDKFQFFIEADGYLISHAGFHPVMIKQIGLRSSRANVPNCLELGLKHDILNIGYSRGGLDPVGGPIWLDWDAEFVDIASMPQIVGHTPHKKPQWKGRSLCLDTHLKDYATLIDGKLEVHEWV